MGHEGAAVPHMRLPQSRLKSHQAILVAQEQLRFFASRLKSVQFSLHNFEAVDFFAASFICCIDSLSVLFDGRLVVTSPNQIFEILEKAFFVFCLAFGWHLSDTLYFALKDKETLVVQINSALPQ